jgi:hypothetical protein
MPYSPDWSPKFHSVAVAGGTIAYAAGDSYGGPLEFTGAAINKDNEVSFGYVCDLYIQEVGIVGAAFDVYLFRGEPTTIADNAALALTSDDLLKAFACVQVASADYKNVIKSGGGTIKWAHKDELQHEFPRGDGNLYAYLVPTGTPTFPSASVINVMLGVWTG